jgi:8-oxo-dGTP pyrophosphatase MutT (NUDIX family)
VLVRAAGGVLWRQGQRQGQGGPEVAVVHRPHYDDWSLPKGKLQPGEHPVQAALREVAEETGCTSRPGRRLGTSGYAVVVDGEWADKTVRWWSLRCTDGAFVSGDEVDELRWLPVPQARDLLSVDLDRHVLDAFVLAPPELDLLVLVRHARAGRRRDWGGEDDDRPLDERGLAQAERLAALLPLHGVDRLLAAPPLRCTATLAPLARALGRPVEVEPLLRDGMAAAEPEAAEALLRSLPSGTVVCAQGEGLPALHARLTGTAPSSWRKGTARLLWSTDGRHVASDPLDPEADG